MQPPKLVLRCLAWSERGAWVAVCLDLSLAAQGASVHQARERLHEQITAYVADALSVDAEHAEVLLNRKAPLLDRLRFVLWVAIAERPRLRRSVARLVERVGVAVRERLAYSEPLPLRLA